MAEDAPEETAAESSTHETTGGGLVRKLFHKKGDQTTELPPRQGVAHIPTTVLTVEYVDDSEGMDAALRTMSERLQKVEEQVNTMQRTQSQLIAAVNQQAKDIGRFVEAIGRRIDRVYKRISGAEATGYRLPAPETPGNDADAPAPVVAEEDLHVEQVEPTAAYGGNSTDANAELAEPSPDNPFTSAPGPAPQVAGDPRHQNAWRVARVLAADLEGYHESAVKEGVLYGTFYKLLREPIEKARRTYEERVPADIVENYDYFSRALDELIVRKRIELEEGGGL
jgi:hypothetical protein